VFNGFATSRDTYRYVLRIISFAFVGGQRKLCLRDWEFRELDIQEVVEFMEVADVLGNVGHGEECEVWTFTPLLYINL
jgi:hypothetical protein